MCFLQGFLDLQSTCFEISWFLDILGANKVAILVMNDSCCWIFWEWEFQSYKNKTNWKPSTMISKDQPPLQPRKLTMKPLLETSLQTRSMFWGSSSRWFSPWFSTTLSFFGKRPWPKPQTKGYSKGTGRSSEVHGGELPRSSARMQLPSSPEIQFPICC